MNLRLSRTSQMVNPSQYVTAIDGEFASWAFNEERAPGLRGRWRAEVFQKEPVFPVDLEIGTGNGFFFAHQALNQPERGLVGLELKFKPLIQSIRRARNGGAENARIVRYHAGLLGDLFEPGEINDVYIFFPDPWPKKKTFKHRLIQEGFLKTLFELQRSGSRIEFKTDHPGYFEWACERFQKSNYLIEAQTTDLHNSQWANENFKTHFEKLWTSKGLKTNYIRLRKS